jgi:hypothetical protein
MPVEKTTPQSHFYIWNLSDRCIYADSTVGTATVITFTRFPTGMGKN